MSYLPQRLEMQRSEVETTWCGVRTPSFKFRFYLIAAVELWMSPPLVRSFGKMEIKLKSSRGAETVHMKAFG